MERGPGPFPCRVCGTELANADDWRRHAKSEWHVYKLQCSVAAPGTIVPPPGEAAVDADAVADGDASGDGGDRADDEDGEQDDGHSSSYGSEEEEEEEEEEPRVTFVPNRCLFCRSSSGTLEDNVAHMRAAHSFIVPYQDCLIVDLETLVWYLNLVIYGYRECILCATRRGTVEAVQQHMIAKGHCRFDLSPDMQDFFHLPASQHRDPSERMRLEDCSSRLSSRRPRSRRSHENTPTTATTSVSRTASQQAPKMDASVESRPLAATSHLIARDDRGSAALLARLSQLSSRDRSSISHLPTYELRSVLATRKKQLDKAQREALRARSKVERLGNRALMKQFKPDNPGRLNG
ncbi:hypothetical protein RJ55_04865 [Drechmeria coniospora]|nr:hypothetical protein RJ55_04865 [Drechmeria coniospora]